MLLNEMQDHEQLNKAVESLLGRVPEFAKARSKDSSFMSHGRDDAPYLVYGDFGFFLRRELEHTETHRAHQPLLRSAFLLIDEMLTSPDPELANLMHVAVL